MDQCFFSGCDFEESALCGFSSEPGLGDWVWVSPLQDNSSTPEAPHTPVDHTYQTAHG